MNTSTYICKFNELAGGRFIIKVATPASSSTLLRTNPSHSEDDDEEKQDDSTTAFRWPSRIIKLDNLRLGNSRGIVYGDLKI